MGFIPVLSGSRQSPTLDLDFQNGVYQWNHVTRQFSGLTNVAGTAAVTPASGLVMATNDKMAVPTTSWVNEKEGTFVIDFHVADATGFGTPFSLSNSTLGTRVEFTAEANYVARFFEGGVGQIPLSNAGFAYTEKRLIIAYKNGRKCSSSGYGVPQYTNGNNFYQPAGPYNANGIGYRVRFNDDATGSKIIRRIRYYPFRQSDAWIEAEAKRTSYSNIHMIGDSFISTELSTDLANNLGTQYRVHTNDGIAGSSLVEQAARFALTPQSWDRTLIIMDGGFSDTEADAKTAVGDMVSHLTHGRWFYVQPGITSTDIIGSPANTAWHLAQDNLKTYFTATHYCDTLDAAFAAGDGSANDNTDIANGVWPRSLRGDTLHPNSLGMAMLATQMSNKITTNGY